MSVRLSVCLSVLGFAECSKEQRSHYQSKMFVCVSTNHADAVDRLLIDINVLNKEHFFMKYGVGLSGILMGSQTNGCLMQMITDNVSRSDWEHLLIDYYQCNDAISYYKNLG